MMASSQEHYLRIGEDDGNPFDMEIIKVNFLDLSCLHKGPIQIYEVCQTTHGLQLVLKLYNSKRAKYFLAVVFPRVGLQEIFTKYDEGKTCYENR